MQIRGDLVGEVSGGRGVRSAPATAKVKKKKKKKKKNGEGDKNRRIMEMRPVDDPPRGHGGHPERQWGNRDR